MFASQFSSFLNWNIISISPHVSLLMQTILIVCWNPTLVLRCFTASQIFVMSTLFVCHCVWSTCFVLPLSGVLYLYICYIVYIKLIVFNQSLVCVMFFWSEKWGSMLGQESTTSWNETEQIICVWLIEINTNYLIDWDLMKLIVTRLIPSVLA